MEIKALILLQVLFDLSAVGLAVWFLLKPRGSGRISSPGDGARRGLEDGIKQWESASRELLLHMKKRLAELKILGEELDRAEIRASDTLSRLERLETLRAPSSERYSRALGEMLEGRPLEEICRSTGVGLDELRLIKTLSAHRRESK